MTATAPFSRPDAPRAAAEFFARTGGDLLTDAFPPKRAAHPTTGARPVPPEAVEALWHEIHARPRSGASIAYLHVSFCETHCLFCGFYQNPWRADAGVTYVDALLAQLERGATTPAQQGQPLRAVYLGGGTPTALATPDLVRLIEGVRRHLPLAPDCEITLEGRILSFGLDKARAAFDAGVNRVSLGVQSFDERLRRRLGRRAGRAEAVRFLEALATLDRGAVVIDLMFGLPDQTPESFAADVGLAAGLGLDGIDLYALNLIPGTPLLVAQEKGKLTPAPRDHLGRFYRAGAEAMDRAGWRWLSCSHWRQGTRERNIYNFEAKSGAHCLAFGAGAGGNLGGTGFRILPRLADYLDRAGSGGCLTTGMMQAGPLAPALNALRSGMERGRLDPLPVSQALGTDFAAVAAPLLDQWCEAGLMRPNHRFLDLTLAGRFWQVTLTGHLIQWLIQESPRHRAVPG
ncbi:heme anaerobic degradation radical SAM methyltransferase ChuW/HutW [Cereibacter sediminicola]|uniref:heme anaerobic degradation radical SAM methyltransferase ChuW/HutW n=1 Tax=Cereibacter sediminicola TaxID=2584941 RepID=UPI001FE67F59|nr:heme anaerobic degradation radical SAM methyltransferase ChuW/HutW [Cereibacter sediminicola]